MNNRDIAKVGFAVLAAVMSYNFADTIVHAEETSVEPVKETAPVENQDNLTDVIDAVVEDTNVPENTEETNVPENTEETDVPKEDEETTTVGGGSDASAKLTEVGQVILYSMLKMVLMLRIVLQRLMVKNIILMRMVIR